MFHCSWLNTKEWNCCEWLSMHVQGSVLSCFNRVRLFLTLWTVARQALLSMGFSRQEYCSGLPCPSPGDSPDPEIKPAVSCITCIGRQILYHWATWEAPSSMEEGMATHYSILAWRMPWIEERDGLQSLGWQRVGRNFIYTHIHGQRVRVHTERVANLPSK